MAYRVNNKEVARPTADAPNVRSDTRAGARVVTLDVALIFAAGVSVLGFFWARFSPPAARVATAVIGGLVQALVIDLVVGFRMAADAQMLRVAFGPAEMWPLVLIDVGLAAGVALGIVLRMRPPAQIQW
jgi:hypothetical protein